MSVRRILTFEIRKIQLDQLDFMVEDMISYRLEHHVRDLVAGKTQRAVLQKRVVFFHSFQVHMDTVEIEP